MPRFKQLASLQDIAMDALAGFFSSNCYNCAEQMIGKNRNSKTARPSDKLRKLVAYMKEDLDLLIPWQLSAEFYNRFLEKCWWPCERIVMEILMQVIMDRRLFGLKCRSRILETLNVDELNRIHGLVELQLEIPMGHVAGLYLGDMRKFTHQRICTDSDLEVIGQNCPRLEYLNVFHSSKVTDVGLRALNPCTNLKTVVVSHCQISPSGINDLLSVNHKIRNLSAWTDSSDEGFDCFSTSDPTVYPSIESFDIRLYDFEDEDSCLRSIVVKFPNLRSIRIIGYLAEDLSVLMSLSQLSSVEIDCELGFDWDKLEPGLRRVGVKVSKLTLSFSGDRPVLQTQLDNIHKFCGDLKYLTIRCQVGYGQEVLTIPPFEKLRNVTFSNEEFTHPGAMQRFHHDTIPGVLKFSQLLELEEIHVGGIILTMETIESLVFDKTKYPRLKSMLLRELPSEYYDIGRLYELSMDNCPITSMECSFRIEE